MKIASFHDYEAEEPVLLKLVTDEPDVDIVAVDSHGDPHPKGRLLSIRESGVYRYGSICPKIGLPLDGAGRLKLYGGDSGDSEIMELLKPLAEYIQSRSKRAEFPMHASYPLGSTGVDGVTLKIGVLNDLADYYERNK